MPQHSRSSKLRTLRCSDLALWLGKAEKCGRVVAWQAQKSLHALKLVQSLARNGTEFSYVEVARLSKSASSRICFGITVEVVDLGQAVSASPSKLAALEKVALQSTDELLYRRL